MRRIKCTLVWCLNGEGHSVCSGELVWEGDASSTEIRIQLVHFWMLCSRSLRVWETKSARAHPHMLYSKTAFEEQLSSYISQYACQRPIRTLMEGVGKGEET